MCVVMLSPHPYHTEILHSVLQLMLYQVIPGAGLSSSQLPDGVSFSTALQNEYLTVSPIPRIVGNERKLLGGAAAKKLLHWQRKQ